MHSYIGITNVQARRRRFIFRLKFYFFISTIFLIFVGLIYFLIVSDFWKIKKFEIFGNKKLSTNEVLYNLKPIIFNESFSRFLGFDHFLSWLGNKDIYLKNPFFANIKISKDFIKREIKINIEEKTPYGVWCQVNRPNNNRIETNDDRISNLLEKNSILFDEYSSESPSCWWFDDEGLIFEAAPYLEGLLIFKILDRSNSSLSLGDKIAEERYYENLKLILDNFKDWGWVAKSFMFDRGLGEFIVVLNNDTKILFSLRFDPRTNISALKLLKDKEGLKNIDYVDLRVENRLYLKSAS